MLLRTIIRNPLQQRRSVLFSFNQSLSRFASKRSNHNNDDDDDDGKVSFINLLRQEEQQLSRSMNVSNEIDDKPREQDFSMSISVEEPKLQDSEIKKHSKNTVKYMNNDNPFYNSEAAAIKRQLDIMDEAFRDWQYNFRLTHKRRPTLREMQSDPRINSILEQRRKKRESVYTTVFKYKIE